MKINLVAGIFGTTGAGLLADIFGKNWRAWQDFMFILAVILAAGLLFFGVALLLTSDAGTDADGKRMAQRVAQYEKQLELRRQTLEIEKNMSELELNESRAELKARQQAASDAEANAKKQQLSAQLNAQQLSEQKLKLTELLMREDTTKKELAKFRQRDGSVVPMDMAVNCLTAGIVERSKLEMSRDYEDCKIPKGATFKYASKDIFDYLGNKPNTSFIPAVGKRAASFKYEDKAEKTSKSFALVSDLGGGKFRITFKCGPDYGAKLCKHQADNFSVASYPIGLLWFTVTNETSPCSLEQLKLLIDISYNIAKIGY